MSRAMTLLESGALVLCLDEECPETPSEAGAVFWHGNGCGHNRFFDKSIQLICTRDGKIALQGEHALFDGSVPLILCKQIQKNKYKRVERNDSKKNVDTGCDTSDGRVPVREIFEECWRDKKFVTMSEDLVHTAQDQYCELIESVEFRALHYKGHGKPFIKKANVSPDAYVQLALQLASYRLFGKQVGTYEATQTRRFLHGRTENTRAVSFQSHAYCRAMDNNNTTKQQKLVLLRDAAKTHHDSTIKGSQGLGVDRHLFGLEMAAKTLKGISPSLFSHPAYTRSKKWRLSTSSLPYTPGFGPVVADGLGVGYSVNNDELIFNISSRKKNHYVNQFCDLLENALNEMKSVCEVGIEK